MSLCCSSVSPQNPVIKSLDRDTSAGCHSNNGALVCAWELLSHSEHTQLCITWNNVSNIIHQLKVGLSRMPEEIMSQLHM